LALRDGREARPSQCFHVLTDGCLPDNARPSHTDARQSRRRPFTRADPGRAGHRPLLPPRSKTRDPPPSGARRATVSSFLAGPVRRGSARWHPILRLVAVPGCGIGTQLAPEPFSGVRAGAPPGFLDRTTHPDPGPGGPPVCHVVPVDRQCSGAPPDRRPARRTSLGLQRTPAFGGRARPGERDLLTGSSSVPEVRHLKYRRRLVEL
jgi:hypothetical protein